VREGDPLHLFLAAVRQVARERDLPDLVDDVLAHFSVLVEEATETELDLRDDTVEAYVCEWGVTQTERDLRPNSGS
jgi:hypothetical protein